jgi:putative heme-binding domain-containing protein
MHGLGDGPLTARLESTWGRVGGTSAERLDQIKQWVQIYEAAPLWAYDTGAGRQHFERLCASCHQDLPENARIAPQLAGSGSKGIGYLVENIVDPNAVVGRDFQATLVLTVQGRVVTGLVTEATEQALTVRTATGVETIARDDIEEIQVSEQSFMPEGLLQGLEEREAIELFKYLLTL